MWRINSIRTCRLSTHARRAFSNRIVNVSSSLWTRRLTFVTIASLTLVIASSHNNNYTLHAADDRAINSKKWIAKAFCDAARKGDVQAMERFIQDNPSVNVDDLRHPLGWTPLTIAAANGQTNAVKWLLDHGANVNAVDAYKFSRRSSPDHLQERRDFHNQINPKISCVGWTPLHYATAFQHLDIIRLLLNAGADTDLINNEGNDPLNVIQWELLPNGDDLRDKTKHMFDEEVSKREAERQEKERLARIANPLEARLRELMVGQVWPILSVSSAIRRRENGFHDANKPLVFLFVGSSGVGKTMLAKSLASELNKGKEDGFIRIDMSEFASKHEMAKLIGAPAGYVGYEEGGRLTNMLQKCPESVVLLDECEKCHPDVLSLMLQVFDEGRLTDGKGTTISCPNAIFIMTSNLVQSEISDAISSGRYQLRPDHVDETLTKQKADSRKQRQNSNFVDVPAVGIDSISSEAISVVTSSMDKFVRRVVHPILKRHFLRDEFIGRINEVVVFHPLSESDLEATVNMELNRWRVKAMDRHRIELVWTPDLTRSLASSYNERYGYRSLIYGCEKRVISLLASAHEQRIISAGDRVELDIEVDESDDENERVVIRRITHNEHPSDSRKGWMNMFG